MKKEKFNFNDCYRNANKVTEYGRVWKELKGVTNLDKEECDCLVMKSEVGELWIDSLNGIIWLIQSNRILLSCI